MQLSQTRAYNNLKSILRGETIRLKKEGRDDLILVNLSKVTYGLLRSFCSRNTKNINIENIHIGYLTDTFFDYCLKNEDVEVNKLVRLGWIEKSKRKNYYIPSYKLKKYIAILEKEVQGFLDTSLSITQFQSCTLGDFIHEIESGIDTIDDRVDSLKEFTGKETLRVDLEYLKKTLRWFVAGVKRSNSFHIPLEKLFMEK